MRAGAPRQAYSATAASRCAVGDHINFDNNGNPLTRFDNPGQIFVQLFMGLTPGMTNTQASAAAAAMRAQDKSVLDLVTSEATSLEGKLSRQDKPRLDEYLSSIRQVEQRIANTADGDALDVHAAARVSTAFNLSDPRGSIDIAHELMALAFQCDATRVFSFQWGLTARRTARTR